MYYECIELCALFENVYFNLQNLVHFLRNCIHWIYIIVTLFEKCVYWIYKIVYILLKNVQCTKLDAIFERCVCWVEYIQNQLWTMFEKCVHWIIKLCRLNVQTCDIVWNIYTLRLCLFHVSDFPENTYFPEKKIFLSVWLHFRKCCEKYFLVFGCMVENAIFLQQQKSKSHRKYIFSHFLTCQTNI